LPEARATGHVPLVARLLLVIGKLRRGAGDLTKAEAALHEAAGAAQDARDDAVAADAWTALVRVVGFNLDRPAEGRVWARYAQAAIERSGGDDEREANRLRALATVVWRRQGARDEARTLIEGARALYQKSRGPRFEAQLASCDEGIAGILFDQARPGEALPLHQRALQVRQRLFGEGHPSLATALVNLGEDLTKLGRAGEALPLLRRAVVLAAASEPRGGDGYYRHRLAAALRATGAGQAALEEDLRAVAASAKAGQRGTYWESWPLTGQGQDLLLLGRPKEAVAPLEQAALERREGTLPIEIAETRFALAQALWESGARPRALALAREALEVLRPDAERYGSWYAVTAKQMEGWLLAHRW
jgi:tetratricopeptide (TPR) repeat protein